MAGILATVMSPCLEITLSLTLALTLTLTQHLSLTLTIPRAGILATALFRGAATPLFFAYVYGWLPPLDDGVVIAYVAVFWFTSGCAYQPSATWPARHAMCITLRCG